ncbi:hypothetical protein [Demequina aestuarii]|uniref:hypothetical protein n=1 Tax=Demequina aestuarii TaxID=327095 RepID=UPI0007816B11|nr:hypothetical protein [Demequina aestuarii]
MTELGSIFNPGEAEMASHLASEKILPAPSPVPGPPLTDANGDEVHIPDLHDLPGAYAPDAALMPPPVRAAHRPDGSPNTD